MAGAGDEDMQTKIEIENELLSINSLVTKIKQELLEINSLVQTDGSLDIALKAATNTLLLMAQKMNVKVDIPDPAPGEENPITNALSKITTQYILGKLETLGHE